jgi:hypothetical protein
MSIKQQISELSSGPDSMKSTTRFLIPLLRDRFGGMLEVR